MPQNVFDETIAATYDADSADMFAPELLEATVDFLAGFAGSRAALEFGIGPGRVALPLSERGVRVAGIDISEAMVARLKAKPGGADIAVTIGDIATTRVPGEFQLVYLPFNIITNLLTQDEQVRCMQNAANHLAAGGVVVAEVSVPSLQRMNVGERFVPFRVSPRHLGIDELDIATQTCVSHHYFLGDGRSQYFASRHRYTWPAELDLMARIAGLELVERWADWKRSPFTSDSSDHVSAWRKRGAPS